MLHDVEECGRRVQSRVRLLFFESGGGSGSYFLESGEFWGNEGIENQVVIIV